MTLTRNPSDAEFIEGVLRPAPPEPEEPAPMPYEEAIKMTAHNAKTKTDVTLEP